MVAGRPMKQSAVLELVNDRLKPEMDQEGRHLDKIDKWLRWDPEELRLPQHSTQEKRYLAKLAETPWLMLVVNTLAQQLIVESVRSGRTDSVAEIMGPWERNRMPSRQRALHHAAIGYGYAYTQILPGSKGAVIRGYSPRKMHCVYQDVVTDEYPMYSLLRSGKHLILTDEVAQYTLGIENGELEFITHDRHNLGFVPVIRYSNSIDLEGRTPGEVEPYIRPAQRINQTTLDRLLVQYHNSWKVRTATGLNEDLSPEERQKEKLRLAQDEILVGGEGVQFATLDETSVAPLVDASKSDVGTLAAVSQTPAHTLTGDMINLSADAITEARAMLDNKASQRKLSLGDSHCQTLRVAAHIEGRPGDAADFSLEAQWADLESRSMSQAADALGKMSTMLGIPPELLWDRIPTVTASEARLWRKYAEEHPSADVQLAAALTRQSNGADT